MAPTGSGSWSRRTARARACSAAAATDAASRPHTLPSAPPTRTEPTQYSINQSLNQLQGWLIRVEGLLISV
jgi:hypothetical protein